MLRITQKNAANSGADPEGGGARPPVFAPNSLKSPLIWPKYMVITSGPPVWWDGEPLAPKVPVSDRWNL